MNEEREGDLCGRAGATEAHLRLRTALKKEKKSELGFGSGPGLELGLGLGCKNKGFEHSRGINNTRAGQKGQGEPSFLG
jgi:hypothetical protein